MEWIKIEIKGKSFLVSTEEATEIFANMQNQLSGHCWGCGKEFIQNDHIFTLIGKQGAFCKDCADGCIIDVEVDETNKIIEYPIPENAKN